MGTRPKSPSLVLNSRQVLASHPELIGKPVIVKINAGNGSLPFLFKVLSIEKALSIQTHPDKKTAEILHAQYPDIYKCLSLHEYLFTCLTQILQTQFTNPKWLWP
jgi:mannose-6-phosphate isomerase